MENVAHYEIKCSNNYWVCVTSYCNAENIYPSSTRRLAQLVTKYFKSTINCFITSCLCSAVFTSLIYCNLLLCKLQINYCWLGKEINSVQVYCQRLDIALDSCILISAQFHTFSCFCSWFITFTDAINSESPFDVSPMVYFSTNSCLCICVKFLWNM